MSIIFYAGIAGFLPHIALWGLLLSRIIVIPLIAGVSYEIIKGAAPHMDHLWVRVAVRPGLWLQKVTTRPPSLTQLEVSIASLRASFTPDQMEEVAGRSRTHALASWQTIKVPDEATA